MTTTETGACCDHERIAHQSGMCADCDNDLIAAHVYVPAGACCEHPKSAHETDYWMGTGACRKCPGDRDSLGRARWYHSYRKARTEAGEAE